MNESEKAILNALKEIKPDANLGDMANFLVSLNQEGFIVKPASSNELE